VEGLGGMAQGVSPEFKPQYYKKKKLSLELVYSLPQKKKHLKIIEYDIYIFEILQAG
jgi:hypothetical protein